jgi:hypothetical protein
VSRDRTVLLGIIEENTDRTAKSLSLFAERKLQDVALLPNKTGRLIETACFGENYTEQPLRNTSN